MFLLGSRGDTAARAGEILLKKFPGLKIVGSSNADPDDQYVIKQLQELRPDILVVAYGAPKQEIWMSTHQDLPIRLVAGLGGTLDMITGTLPRAPKFFRVVHFEWLWRLVLQPKRFKRIFQALLVFPYKVLTTKY
jgi:N-acetylglucosaminyldiphosphoundecaprenol N-acetyl-beta-D-mannosaminyltransferase